MKISILIVFISNLIFKIPENYISFIPIESCNLISLKKNKEMMDHKWLVMYFAIALESDFTILESLLWISKQPLSMKTFRKICDSKFILICGKRCTGKSHLAKQLIRQNKIINLDTKLEPSISLLDLTDTTVILDDIIYTRRQIFYFRELQLKIWNTLNAQLIVIFQHVNDIFYEAQYADCYLVNRLSNTKEKRRMCERHLNIPSEDYPELEAFQWFVYVRKFEYRNILHTYEESIS